VSWSRRDVVPLVVTAFGADGTSLYRYCDLRAGRSKAARIELPDGTVVQIERPLRERVDLGQLRAGRATRPTWWRALLAEQAARRAIRRRR
jgi:hypothetical protein